MSFNDALNRIKEILETDAALQALVATFSSRALSVKRAYKHREEIGLDELPVILITRPETDGSAESAISGGYRHTVGLYCGFYCEDHEQAQQNLVSFEEAIEAAIMRDMTLSGNVDFIGPGPSRNDEGKNHPAYFVVKTFSASKEVVW